MALTVDDLGIDKPDCGALAVGDMLAGSIQNLTSTFMPARYANALSDAAFYCEIRNYVLYDSMIDFWMGEVIGRISTVIMVLAVVFVTLWIVWAGIKLVSGTSKEPAMMLVAQGVKIVVVMTLIVGISSETDTVIHTAYQWRDDITAIVTGDDANLVELIDMNMAVSQILSLVKDNMIQGGSVDRQGGTSDWLAIAGQSGPPIMTSILVMISEVAIAVCMMLAPLFLFFLLFKSTSQMFWSWLKFVAGTFVTMAFLCIVAKIALEGTFRYGILVVLSSVLNAAASVAGGNSLAEGGLIILTGGASRADVAAGMTRLGAMGALFSVLIIAVPPVVMQLFGSAMGYAQSILSGIYSPMAGMAARGGAGGAAGANGAAGPAGAPGYSAAPQLGMAGMNGAPGERGSVNLASQNAQYLANAANSNVMSQDDAITRQASRFDADGGRRPFLNRLTENYDPDRGAARQQLIDQGMREQRPQLSYSATRSTGGYASDNFSRVQASTAAIDQTNSGTTVGGSAPADRARTLGNQPPVESFTGDNRRAKPHGS
ncbi:type IV secretion system protein [Hydrogenophaga sp. 5NK40-0174]|uniref:type IV secretion system protein n=1 Tax=Hydrogenophaga sp. 5NK40-0174 TaxID=3127649 RepID=UPI0031084832